MNTLTQPIAIAILTTAASAQSVWCVQPDAAIPDDEASGAVIAVPIDLPPGSLITAIEVDLVIDHPWVGDLDVRLVAPGGAAVRLLDRPGLPSVGFPGPFGCGGAGVDARFTDDAVSDAESACSLTQTPVIAGELTPADPLASLIGLDASGAWSLIVSDRSSYDAGTVVSVCVRVTAQAACAPDLAEPMGVLNFFDLQAFVGLFNAQASPADLAEPKGVFNFFDVQAYVALFNAGCP